MDTLILIIQIALGILFFILSIFSLKGSNYTKTKMKHLRMPSYFRYFTGFVQLVGGILMLTGLWWNKLSVFGGVWISLIMLTGLMLRLRAGDTLKSTFPAIVIFIFSFIVIIFSL